MIVDKIKLKYLGHVLVIVSVYFIAKSLISLDTDLDSLYSYYSPKNIFYTLISLLIYIAAIYTGSLLWIFLLRQLSRDPSLPTGSLVGIYSQANLCKYLPGNVMHFVARNVLATKFQLSHKIIAAASFIETAFSLTSGVFLLILITFFITIDIDIESYNEYLSYQYLYIALCILFVLFTLIYIFRKKLSLNIESIKSSIPGFAVLLQAFSGYVFIYLILGVGLMLIMMIFDSIALTSSNYWNILFVFIFSWIIGFVVPGAPGGIGVREAIFILLLSQNYPEQAVIFVALLYRLINIIGDVIFYFITNKSLRGGSPIT